MPSIQFYADGEDFKAIFARLSADADVAVILPDGRRNWLGRRKWIARRLEAELGDGAYCLWHVPAGGLPLGPPGSRDADATIPDPFSGWTERHAGQDPRVPFFGSIPGVVTLNVNRASREKAGGIGQSAFGWIGNRYRTESLPADAATERWWRNLSRWVADTAGRKITRWGNPDGDDADIWAFASAYEKIVAGAHRDANPAG